MKDTKESEREVKNEKMEICNHRNFMRTECFFTSQCIGSKKVRSRSTTGRTDFTDSVMLDEMIASALKKLSHACALPKKSKCRRAACSIRRPILAKEADCIHDLGAFSRHWSL